MEPNGTYTIVADDERVYLEYAHPRDVPALMAEVIERLNTAEARQLTYDDAPAFYAAIHAAVAHIHPFWDGNGRIARLLANIPLLKAGLPPLTIPEEQRRTYIQLLADYQITIGQLDETTGAWPDVSKLVDFNRFCESCYGATRDLAAAAFEIQKKRV